MKMVLLVDDDEDVRDALGDLLKLRGFNLKIAGNGLEALQLLQNDGIPCVILLDLVMPVMDGWQFLKRLQSSPSLSSIPVVVISAHAASNPPTGVNRIIAKPVDTDALYAAVDEHCSQAN